MPYGFYQFVRFAGLVGFAILAYQAHEQGRQTEMIIYAGLGLLFQPFFKIQPKNAKETSSHSRQ